MIIGSGFLSRHVAESFMDDGNDVIVLYYNHDIPNFSGKQLKINYSSNIKDQILEYDPDYILLSKGDSFVNDNLNIIESINNNVTPTTEILDIIYNNNLNSLKKIILIGSAAEYSKKNSAIIETDPIFPTSIYGLSKIFLYNSAMYYINKGLPIIYVRQFNAIGPYQRDQFVLSYFATSLVDIERGSKPKINVGDLTCERDFIDGRDAAIAYKLLFNNGIIGDVYNIGSGVSVKVNILLDTLISKLNYNGNIEVVSNSNKLKNNGLGNILLSNNDKLIGLGFKQKYSLDNTVEDTLNYWRNVQK